ncbi:hypothetical protein [Agrobacterium pusense]|uniref:hypothetical protein n=1 Tax=Agrobacterium pusense TaxID=648995 RepID=UPI002F3F253E
MSYVRKYYTADLHLGHSNIRESCPATRNFAIVEEMDIAIMCAINERVGKDDILYILGDFAVCADAEYVRHCFNMLNGRKRLILGNHDLDKKGRVKRNIRDLPWDRTPTHAVETNDEGCRLYLHHYACRTWPAAHHGSYHFFGHSHGNLPPMGRSRDVGIDCPDTNFGPMTFAEIKETLMSVETAWYQSLVAAFGVAVPPLESFRCRHVLQPMLWQMYADLEARDLLKSVEIVGIETRERGWVTISRRLDPGLSAADRRACDDLLTEWDMDLSEVDRRD